MRFMLFLVLLIGVLAPAISVSFAQPDSQQEILSGELPGAESVNRHEMDIPAFHQVRVTLRSTTFDPYLEVYTVAERTIGENDDTDGSLNAVVEFTAMEAETYIFQVSSRNGDGAYEIEVTLTAMSKLNFGVTWAEFLFPDVPARSYYFEAERGDVLIVSVTDIASSAPSVGFTLSDANGDSLYSNFVYDTRDHVLGAPIAIPAEGVYQLEFWISLQDPNTGRFVEGQAEFFLRIERDPIEVIHYGDTVEGTLTEDNQVAIYQLDGLQSAGIHAVVDSEIDTTLGIQYISNGYELYYSDDDGAGFNPEFFNYRLHTDTQYLLIVRPAERGLTGTFTLTVTRAER